VLWRVAQRACLHLALQAQTAGLLGGGRVEQALLQLVPAALPRQFHLGLALQAGARQRITAQGQARQPLAQLLGLRDLQLQLALAAVGAGIQGQLGAGAGHLQLQLALQVLGVGADVQRPGLQQALQRLDLDIAQLQQRGLPAALCTGRLQAQGPRMAGACRLQVQCELHPLRSIGLCLQRARNGGGLQRAVQVGGVDARQFDRAFHRLRLGVPAGLGLQLAFAGGAQIDPGALQQPDVQAVKAQVGAQGPHWQGLPVPGAGQAVVQVGLELPALGLGAGLQRAVQVGAGATGQEQGRVHMAQLHLCRFQRLGPPGLQGGADVGGQAGVLAGGRGGRARLGGDFQARGLGGQGALHAGLGRDVEELVVLLGQRGLDRALQLGMQGHRGGRLQAQVSFVEALRVTQAADFQRVVAAGVGVVALQFGDHGFRRAFPDQALDAHRHVDAHRQQQRLQRRGRGVVLGLGGAADAQLVHVHLAEAQLALQQRLQAPGDVGAFDLDLQRRAGPAQPVDAATVPQAAFDAVGFQFLVGRHPAGHAGQGARQGVALARPPPGQAQQAGQGDQAQGQGPQQSAQPAAAATRGDWCRRRGGGRRRSEGRFLPFLHGIRN